MYSRQKPGVVQNVRPARATSPPVRPHSSRSSRCARLERLLARLARPGRQLEELPPRRLAQLANERHPAVARRRRRSPPRRDARRSRARASPHRSTLTRDQPAVVDDARRRPASSGEPLHEPRSSGDRTTAAAPAAAFSAARSGRLVAGIATSTRSSESTHLSSACAHVSTPNSRSGASSSGARRAPDERALAERPHHDHRHPELRRERQQLPLAPRARAGCTGAAPTSNARRCAAPRRAPANAPDA